MPRPRPDGAARGCFERFGVDVTEPNVVEGLGDHRNAPGSSSYFATSSSAFSKAATASPGVQPLANINCTRLENILHRVFSAAQLDLTIEDRFGNPVRPREWFLVPLSVIDQAVEKVRDGSIVEFEYDPSIAALRKAEVVYRSTS